jgi:hypothetical protein
VTKLAEPTESEILQRAKQLCADDGYAWSEADEPLDTEDGDIRKVIDGSARVENRKRATVQLALEAVESE